MSDTDDALAAAAARVAERLRDPDLFSRALTQYAVTRWVAALGEAGVVGGTSASVAMGTRSEQTGSTKLDDGSTTDCHTHHISVLGHEIIAWGTCHTGSSTGSGHTSIEVMHPTHH